ncbi:hypothetical protein [Deinococcus misasensis]|uniref:hypothetical protein n=1 Tax=Deinococcus misasensis TaxID=392413 RepID=UPI00054FDC88|nr:hypothetical protein [Deinococcus misasensis]
MAQFTNFQQFTVICPAADVSKAFQGTINQFAQIGQQSGKARKIVNVEHQIASLSEDRVVLSVIFFFNEEDAKTGN